MINASSRAISINKYNDERESIKATHQIITRTNKRNTKYYIFIVFIYNNDV